MSRCCHETVAVELQAQPHAFLHHISWFTVEHVTENTPSFLISAIMHRLFLKSVFNNSCWASVLLRLLSVVCSPAESKSLSSVLPYIWAFHLHRNPKTTTTLSTGGSRVGLLKLFTALWKCCWLKREAAQHRSLLSYKPSFCAQLRWDGDKGHFH